MISAVKVCVEYGGVYVFHVCFDLCVVYGVDVCGAVCIVESRLFLTSGCCMLCCYVV